MTLSETVQITQYLLAGAIAVQSIEFLVQSRDRWLALRLILCLMLLYPPAASVAVWGLWLFSLAQLHRFDGPYNGGSDKMTLLILTCLGLYHLAPTDYWRELAVSYLAVQLVLSYFVSGYIKIINADWRAGRALCDVFRFSAYPVAESLRDWASFPRLLCAMSWGVMGFEVLMPLALLNPLTLKLGLCIAGLFHLMNALLFGLNRFFWIWICAYPALIWFQAAVVHPLIGL